jgi:hypothetical protein
MIDALPPLSSYTSLAETGTVRPGTFEERFSLNPRQLVEQEPAVREAQFWIDLVRWMETSDFSNLLLEKFQSGITSRFGTGNKFSLGLETRLIRDFTNYAIGPHTDSPRKMVSLLFYLPRDDSLRHMGTTIFEPLDADFVCDGSKHHDFANFREVYMAPFRANSLFAFCKTENAFHGVTPIRDANIERNLLLYNIYLNEIVPPKPPRRGIRWPWSRA